MSPDDRSAMDVPKEERLARYQELYDRGGFALWLGNFSDSFTNREHADEVAEFMAEKIRQRVKDPVKAEKLIPKSHTFGTKRCPGEKNFYEIFNLPHVDIVDLRETPITRITPEGIQVGDELHELDVIIYATGFHSVTGELMRIDIRGEGGKSLQEHWSDGPRTNLGVQFSGIPPIYGRLWGHITQRCSAISHDALKIMWSGSPTVSGICAIKVLRPCVRRWKLKTSGRKRVTIQPKVC